MALLDDLKFKFNNLDAFGKIIAINAIVFIIDLLLTSLFKLGNVMGYFKLPSDLSEFIVQPWSIITYGFLHSGFLHIIFNMLLLYYLSRLAINLFRQKMVLNIYFLGIICGGLAYLLVANLWPTDFFGTRGILIGASAGVSALLLFVAAYMPNSEIRLFNMFTVKWKHIAMVFIGYDLFKMLMGFNQGGYVSHFGGYLLGYVYAVQLQKGTDIGKGFERLADSFANLFKPKSKLKTVHKKPRSQSRSSASQTKSDSKTLDKQKQIDAILDKISKSGYDSLTAKEKEFLFKAGKD
ncbi:rhomboid family intramembrane serine protease [Winogradskyella sp. A3E31]|uniref:rhomboid family intramembrane serine protease n=1 Tax=Winogradskyella sp. A3E31 TaxID=3349637 RepID=UPI00398B43DB